jgi:TPP-dependent indolepyruvate ferredoxin oxidoreductase alpha subunit
MNEDMSFPYPKMASVRRPRGQGCLSCVNKLCCPAMYWFRRRAFELGTIDDNMGVQCASWSNLTTEIMRDPPTEADLDEEEYIFIQGTASEPDRSGITDAVSG